MKKFAVPLTVGGFVSLLLSIAMYTVMTLNTALVDTVASVRTSVVHIEKVGAWQGSGFIATEDGLIVTARHVVEGGGLFLVTLDDGTVYSTHNAVESANYDVGFLKIEPNEPLPVVDMVDVPLRPGDYVFIMGSPLGKDNFNSVTLGIISSDLRNFDTGSTAGWGWSVLFQSDSPAFPGNSGGPVFNIDGYVIGILVGGAGEGLNYSIPTRVFMNQLDIVLHLLAEQSFEIVEEQVTTIPAEAESLHSWE